MKKIVRSIKKWYYWTRLKEAKNSVYFQIDKDKEIKKWVRKIIAA